MLDKGFNSQPTLEGKLVHVRPLRESDYENLYHAASDPIIWEQHPVKNRHEPVEFRKYFEESIESGGALAVSNSNQLIGSTRYHNYNPDESEIEIGWTFLVRKCWGGAFNNELKYLTMRHAFLYVETIVYLIDEKNIRSQRSVERLGATRKGIRSKENGVEMLLYEISKHVFNSRFKKNLDKL